jgi:uracil-DNA glycosylase
LPIKPSGPQPSRILLVGEAPGQDEENLGIPFVGASGQELKRMFEQAGLDWKVRKTNLFLSRPVENKIENFCGNRAAVGRDYPYPPFASGKYFLPSLVNPALESLANEINHTSPDLIIAVGNTPCWALLQRTGISKLRGSIFSTSLGGRDTPVLPTYHPAAVLRDWSLRPIVIADLLKVGRFLAGDIRPVRRELWLDPTLAEVEDFFHRFILGDNRPDLLSVDIETFAETITCIGFAPSPTRAITVPFFDRRKADRNYWATLEEELRAWRLCHLALTSRIPKLGQNFLYDAQYLFRHSILVENIAHDTMIRHHALYPEMEKGLGFLASIYTDEAPWKVLRDRNKDNFKIDDE